MFLFAVSGLESFFGLLLNELTLETSLGFALVLSICSQFNIRSCLIPSSLLIAALFDICMPFSVSINELILWSMVWFFIHFAFRYEYFFLINVEKTPLFAYLAFDIKSTC